MEDILVEKLEHSLKVRKEVFLLTVTDYPNRDWIGRKALLWPNGAVFSHPPLPDALVTLLLKNSTRLVRKKRSGMIHFSCPGGEIEWFAEFFPAPPRLIVAGAGHVSEPVVKIGKMLGFFVTVIDDRPEYANNERFPIADEVFCQSYLQFFQEVSLTAQTYILLLTRGHKYDVLSLQELLRRHEKAAYIGMIGSRRRISGVFAELRQEFPVESFNHLYTPVGLDLGAESPAEIAVSIMAEILKVKNQKSGSSLSAAIRKYAQMGFHEGARNANGTAAPD